MQQHEYSRWHLTKSQWLYRMVTAQVLLKKFISLISISMAICAAQTAVPDDISTDSAEETYVTDSISIATYNVPMVIQFQVYKGSLNFAIESLPSLDP